MIFKGSRYEQTPVREMTGADGRTIRYLGIRPTPATPAGYLHTFTSDERLDLLAYAFYGNPEKFWLIADANDAMDPEDLLEPGRTLRIPPDRT